MKDKRSGKRERKDRETNGPDQRKFVRLINTIEFDQVSHKGYGKKKEIVLGKIEKIKIKSLDLEETENYWMIEDIIFINILCKHNCTNPSSSQNEPIYRESNQNQIIKYMKY